MFNVNDKVKHFKFGEGHIVDFEPRDEMLKSVVTIDFNNGDTKKLTISSFGPNDMGKVFMTSENTEVRPFIDSLIEEAEQKRLETIKQRNIPKKIDLNKVYRYDEHERIVTKKDWERCYEVAETYRFFHESRAVVMDDERVFINAACGLRFCESDPRSGDKVYERCEGIYRSKFAGARWRYAKKEEIKEIIDNWDKIENDTE